MGIRTRGVASVVGAMARMGQIIMNAFPRQSAVTREFVEATVVPKREYGVCVWDIREEGTGIADNACQFQTLRVS